MSNLNLYKLKISPRSWHEDFCLENGNYIRVCCYCREEFIGYKRRVVCRKCAYKKPFTLIVMKFIRFIFYPAAVLLFLWTGFKYGFTNTYRHGNVWPWLILVVVICAVIEYSTYRTKRKYRDDK
jgi:hypothetical protein